MLKKETYLRPQVEDLDLRAYSLLNTLSYPAIIDAEYAELEDQLGWGN